MPLRKYIFFTLFAFSINAALVLASTASFLDAAETTFSNISSYQDNVALCDLSMTFLKIPMVTVGDPGNETDPTTGFGAVQKTFQIGANNVTVREYCSFLNHVASTDTYGLYDMNMGSDGLVACIERSGTSGHYHYELVKEEGIEKFPITCVSWFSAARFCNWLHNGQPRGDEDLRTTESGAYTLNGAIDGAIIPAAANARYFLPSEDQWYKAAYYKAGRPRAGYWIYPFQSDAEPSSFEEAVHAPGPYGTYNMGGDVFQWTSSADDSSRSILRGGDWAEANFLQEIVATFRTNAPSTTQSNSIGFRVAAPTVVPEVLLQCSQQEYAPISSSSAQTSPSAISNTQNTHPSSDAFSTSNLIKSSSTFELGPMVEVISEFVTALRSWFSSLGRGGYTPIPNLPEAEPPPYSSFFSSSSNQRSNAFSGSRTANSQEAPLMLKPTSVNKTSSTYGTRILPTKSKSAAPASTPITTINI